MGIVLYNELNNNWEDLRASKNFQVAMNDRFNFVRGFIEIKKTDIEDLEFLQSFAKVAELAANQILKTITENSVAYIDEVK